MAGAFLLLLSTVMRGGNRHVALIVLEAVAIGVLFCLCARFLLREQLATPEAPRVDRLARWTLLLSPLILALVHLLPIPFDVWAATPGRSLYLQTLHEAGLSTPKYLPLSVVPEATIVSLLAGIPLVAAFLLGQGCGMQQIRMLFKVVVAISFAQVLLGLLQVAEGSASPWYFDAVGAGRPMGTFANSNHFANYLAMALILYLWLGWESLAREGLHAFRQAGRGRVAVWLAGGLVLVLGVLLTRSRGATLAGLATAALALGWLMAAGSSRRTAARTISAVLALVVAGAVATLGLDFVTSRFTADELVNSASFRAQLTQTTLAGAAEFWPWGAGWGVYNAVYPRFQPLGIPGGAGHAHQDYAQMLFEGGMFSLLFAAAFLWLGVRRGVLLWRLNSRRKPLGREAVASVLCGLGLLGFLLHSLVEFNMHIPANAILASMLAGVYLRPLAAAGAPHDRSAQPHPAGH